MSVEMLAVLVGSVLVATAIATYRRLNRAHIALLERLAADNRFVTLGVMKWGGRMEWVIEVTATIAALDRSARWLLLRNVDGNWPVDAAFLHRLERYGVAISNLRWIHVDGETTRL